MIRRVGVSGLTLLLASSALALGVLTIGGPYSADVEWLSNQASFSPVVLEKPDAVLPAVSGEKMVAFADIGHERPAAIRINPPTVAAGDLDDARIRTVEVDAPELALRAIFPTGAGALTAVAAIEIEAPAPAEDPGDSGILLASLGTPEAVLPDVPTTKPGALAKVTAVAIQPPDTRPLERMLEAGFVTCDKIGGAT